jgi:Ca2+-binding RTX toxin-like protein
MTAFSIDNIIPFAVSNATLFSASSAYGPYTPYSTSATEFVVRSQALVIDQVGGGIRFYGSFFVRYIGTDFSFDSGSRPTGGTYMSVQLLDRDGTLIATLSGLNRPLTEVFDIDAGSVFVGADTLTGGGNAGEVFYGGFGDDYIDSGASTIFNYQGGASPERDVLYGEVGDDILIGGAGMQSLVGGPGRDVMTGNGGDDLYSVDDIWDEVYESAGGGNDIVMTSVSYGLRFGTEVEQLVAAGSGSIKLYGNEFANIVTGNAEENRIEGGDGDDSLYGLAGNDTLLGGEGADIIDGGAGVDTVRYDDINSFASVRLSLTNHIAATGMALGDTFFDVENVITGNASDQIFGNAGVNVVQSGGGNDQLFGRANDDRLFGGEGHDVLWGGMGADQLDGGGGFDYAAYDDDSYAGFVIALDGQAANTGVAAGDSFQSIEGFLLGTGADVAYGSTDANYLYGRDGNDTLYGKEGNDTLFGEAGADRFIFDTMINGADADTLADFQSGVDRIGLSHFFYGAVDGGGGAVRYFEGNGITGADVHALIGVMLFDPASHWLRYDGDGAGQDSAVDVAFLPNVSNLTASDFFFV